MNLNKLSIGRFIAVLNLSFFIGGELHAFRCGNNLILEGESVNKVMRACGEPEGGYSNSVLTSVDALTYSDGAGMMCNLRIVNGQVSAINCNRSL